MTDAQRELLDHVDYLSRYWAGDESAHSNVSKDKPVQERLDGLAFSILVMLDGGAAVGPYEVCPLVDDGTGVSTSQSDVAGALHDQFKRVCLENRCESS